MSRAFAELFGVSEAFAGIEIAGRTDTFLSSQALTRGGLADSPENHRRFRDAYVAVLADEIQHPGRGRRGVMPGVPSLLERLRQDATFHLALLTGNYEPAA